MRKWIGFIVVAGLVGLLMTPAGAVVDVYGGENEAHIKDVSHLYRLDSSGAWAPIPLTGSDSLPRIGDELRAVLRVDDLQIVGGATYWVHSPSTTGDEVTGLMYDLELTHVDAMGNMWFSPLGRNGLVAADDVDGDIVPLFGAAWGGVLELYQDPSPDMTASLSGALGNDPSDWLVSGGPVSRASLSTADGFPDATDGSLWLSGALLDLNLFGAYPAGDTPGNLYVYVLTKNVLPNQYTGTGFMHAFDGYAQAQMELGLEPKLPPGAFLADVSISNNITLGTNAFLNPTWLAGSTDPVRFDTPIPEPTIIALFGMSVLGGLIRRRF